MYEPYTEICFFPMREIKEGHCTLFSIGEGHKGEPDFYDVMVFGHGGIMEETLILEEFQDLSLTDATNAFRLMEIKYPDAEINTY